MLSPGQHISHFGEFKTINPGARYAFADVWRGQQRAVEKRAAALQGEYNHTLHQKDTLFFGTADEQVGPLRTALHSRKFAGFAVGRVGEASQSIAKFHTMVAHLAVDRRGRVIGALTRESAIPATERRLLVDLSMSSWRGWADFLLGRVQFVGMSARQIRACTQHGRLRDPSPAGIDDSYNACMHTAAASTALAPHTHPAGW